MSEASKPEAHSASRMIQWAELRAKDAAARAERYDEAAAAFRRDHSPMAEAEARANAGAWRDNAQYWRERAAAWRDHGMSESARAETAQRMEMKR